jgi:hypothetical protein
VQKQLAQTETCKDKDCNFLIATCNFGSNGLVTFREAERQEGVNRRLTQTCSRGNECDDDFNEDSFYDPKLEGNFAMKNLDRDAEYILSIHEYNDLGRKCRYVGEFYNPRNFKHAPGVKKFKTDCDGKF